jgi:hypothetical protein
MWVNCQAVDGSETLPTATFTFLNCSMSGGDGGNVTATDPILTLCGAMNVQWVGGNFRGAVRYIKSTQLSTATNLAAGVRTEVSFVGLKWAPHPSISIIVFDPSGGGSGAAGPVFTWRACGNVPDMEIGGEIGQNYRQPHSVKFQPYLKGHMGVSYVASPYPGTVDFAGRTVRIDKILFVVLGTMPAGTKRIEAFSDAARTLSLGYFVTTFTGAAFMELPLDLSPTIIVDKLYLLLTTPVAADVRGYYLIDYTVLD